MKGLGIDVGSGSISLAVVENDRIIYQDYVLHQGKIVHTLERMLEKLEQQYPGESFFSAASSAAASLYPQAGRQAKADRVTALLAGQKVFYPQAGSMMEMGAQTSCFVTGMREGQSLEYAVNGECAAGTGSFFEDQMYRLGLPIDAYSDYVRRAKTIPRLAGRCSVFAKTDLIHQQQEGVSPEDILLGLAFAVVRNFKTSVVRGLPVRRPVLLAGGVVKNEGVRRALQQVFSLEEGELVCEENGAVLAAAGLAVLALERKTVFDWRRPAAETREQKGAARPLPFYSYPKDRLHQTRPRRAGEQLWLGIDVGSTSTNLVLIGENGDVLDYQYLRTAGRPVDTVKHGMELWSSRYGDLLAEAEWAVTGSGRYLIAEMLGAGMVIDEITAQARAAAFLCPEADTVFEIGGQDSKFIRIRSGQVVEFEMNKVCAAGTGSFVEEQAGRMSVGLAQIGPDALQASAPAELGERCTVLMESKIAAELAEGTPIPDICAGLCRSIVRNYLTRVVGNKKVGNVICLQGGIVHNEGIVSAFYEQYGDRLHITPYYDVTGAYGAALEARSAKKAVQTDEAKNREVYGRSQQWFLAGYDGTLKPDRKTIGIPRSLMIYKFFPMAYPYFTELGYNVLLSPETNEEIIGLAQQLTQEETCYPVKLLHGHMEWLARKGVDYMFIPCVRTIQHKLSKVDHNYGCVYMQAAPKLVARTLELEKRGIRLIAPVLDLDMGRPQLAGAMIKAGVGLGRPKPICEAALAKGAEAMVRCEKQSEQTGREMMAALRPEDKVLVLITRNYGISDPVLNMGIPGELLKRGCKVLTLAHLQGHDVDLSEEYPNMYWPFGQHILSGAKIIRSHPNLYAVYLTNHGCGPDTMISHLFREIMGDKPYLSIEVDEHQSSVGVVTRIEAFLNSLKHTENNIEPENIEPEKPQKIRQAVRLEELEPGETLYLPPLSVYSEWYASMLRGRGICARALPDFTADDLKEGKAESISKEYCTFSAAVGQSLRLWKEKGRDSPYRQMIFQTGGAEAEGVAARVIGSIIPGGAWYTPFAERILDQTDADENWQMILMGDAYQYLEPELQRELAGMEFGKTMMPLSWERTRRLLKQWHSQGSIGKRKQPRVFMFGAPSVLHSPFLNREMTECLHMHNLTPVPMSMAEYLWFWIRESGREIPEKFTRQLEEFQEIYEDVLGTPEKMENRFAGLRQHFPEVTGGNLRYLGHLISSELPGCVGNILMTPAYANYASVIELMKEKGPLPFFHFQVDGNKDASEIERREIFFNTLSGAARQP